MIVLCVLSGGQDSTTCLHWAKKEFSSTDIAAVTFTYGQKHVREVGCAAEVASRAGVPHYMVELCRLYGTSPLVNPQSDLGQYKKIEDLPGGVEPTFIPCRNILFFTMAANFALHLEQRKPGEPSDVALVTGVCEADFAGYFDCRNAFVVSMANTLNEGLFGDDPEIGSLEIHTPLMQLTKKQTVELARDLGCLEEMAYTHTCYTGEEKPCRHCHACMIRERGFVEAGEVDPLVLKHHGSWPPEWAMR